MLAFLGDIVRTQDVSNFVLHDENSIKLDTFTPVSMTMTLFQSHRSTWAVSCISEQVLIRSSSNFVLLLYLDKFSSDQVPTLYGCCIWTSSHPIKFQLCTAVVPEHAHSQCASIALACTIILEAIDALLGLEQTFNVSLLSKSIQVKSFKLFMTIILPSRSTPQQGTADAEIKSHLLRTQSSKVLPLKPGVGQNIAMPALPTARDFLFANFYLPRPFTSIFPEILRNWICPVLVVLLQFPV